MPESESGALPLGDAPILWWREMDSNHRSLRQQIYSLPPLATWVSLHWEWCPGAESNHRHEDFQSSALPTELPGHCVTADFGKARIKPGADAGVKWRRNHPGGIYPLAASYSSLSRNLSICSCR